MPAQPEGGKFHEWSACTFGPQKSSEYQRMWSSKHTAGGYWPSCLASRCTRLVLFVPVRDLLAGNPHFLDDYNRLKQAHEGAPKDDYSREKAQFMEALVSRARD